MHQLPSDIASKGKNKRGRQRDDNGSNIEKERESRLMTEEQNF